MAKIGWNKLFGLKKQVLMGMVHCQAFPGTPRAKFPTARIVDIACQEAETYKKAGIDAIIVENMHDIPYMKKVGPETISYMTKVCSEVRRTVPGLACGIQILAGANEEALAVASSSGFDFIRAEGYVFSHIADEGFLDACAGSLLRFRKKINAEHVLVFADIKKKHSSHSITSDVSLSQTAAAAEFFLSDAVIVTGVATGAPVDVHHLEEVSKSATIPVLVGSGVTLRNVSDYGTASGLIVGTYFKVGDRWDGELDVDKIKCLVEKVNQAVESKPDVGNRK